MVEEQSQRIIKQGREMGEKLKAEIIEKANASSQHMIEAAKDEIQREKDAALVELRTEVADLAIMAVREGLEFEATIESDCAPLAGLVGDLLEAGVEIHCLRDLTRGGLASALIEIAEAARLTISIEESRIPVREDVQGACEILGFDPLYVANEGRFVCLLPAAEAERALRIMRASPLGAEACLIGQVTEDASSLVTMRSRIGASRVVDMLSGEQLPRIC
jgi:hydrogenase expression/formation protein HypE